MSSSDLDLDGLRAAVVALIGDDNVTALENSGMFTIEEQWYLDQANRTTTAARDTVPYLRQQRYVSSWCTMPDDTTVDDGTTAAVAPAVSGTVT